MERRTILMSPDYGDCLFWDEYEDCLSCCGGATFVFIGHEEIDLKSVKGLKSWYNEWNDETLIHKHNWKNKQWKEWWQRGLELAKQVKKLLPENIILEYFTLTDKVWKSTPLDSIDGGLFDYGEPMEVINEIELTPMQRLFILLCKRLELPSEQTAICLSIFIEEELHEIMDWAINLLKSREVPNIELYELTAKVAEIVHRKQKW